MNLFFFFLQVSSPNSYSIAKLNNVKKMQNAKLLNHSDYSFEKEELCQMPLCECMIGSGLSFARKTHDLKKQLSNHEKIFLLTQS